MSVELKFFHGWLDLHVAQLPDIEILGCRACAPAQKDVAGRLHHVVSVHNPLPVVGEDALTSVRFQHRGSRLLNMEE